jgi:hypothetical protein
MMTVSVFNITLLENHRLVQSDDFYCEHSIIGRGFPTTAMAASTLLYAGYNTMLQSLDLVFDA